MGAGARHQGAAFCARHEGDARSVEQVLRRNDWRQLLDWRLRQERQQRSSPVKGRARWSASDPQPTSTAEWRSAGLADMCQDRWMLLQRIAEGTG